MPLASQGKYADFSFEWYLDVGSAVVLNAVILCFSPFVIQVRLLKQGQSLSTAKSMCFSVVSRQSSKGRVSETRAEEAYIRFCKTPFARLGRTSGRPTVACFRRMSASCCGAFSGRVAGPRHVLEALVSQKTTTSPARPEHALHKQPVRG